jgi:RNA polymerase sigma factor (sigma-70 family)
MSSPLDKVVHRLRAQVAAQALEDCADAQLMERFVTAHDEEAFAAMVRRHGGMVLGVCRRLLRHSQDAEDACQAVFLILARKANAIRKRDSLGSWLHGVARRVARRLRQQLSRQQQREARLVEEVVAATGERSWREVQAVLDEEIGRLPARYQAPIVLCYLEGKTQDEAARQLGWSVSTLRGRLERGRGRLRFRLTRRGLTLGAALLGTNLAAGGVVPPGLVESLNLSAQGSQTLAMNTVSPHIAALAKGVIRTMWWQKVQTVAVLFLFAAAVSMAGLLLPFQSLATPEPGELKTIVVEAGGQKQPAPAKLMLNYPTMVQREEVAKELEITDEQKNKFDKIKDDINKKFQEEKKKIEALPLKEELEAYSKLKSTIYGDTNKQFREQMAKILDAKQLKRLAQLDLQWQVWDLVVFNNKELAEALKLSDEQKKNAKKAFQELADELQKSLGVKQGDPVLLPKTIQEHWAAQEKVFPMAKKQWLDLLTPEQRKTWEEWIGKPFEFAKPGK